MSEQSPNWDNEQQRVNQVKEEISNKINKLTNSTKGLKEGILEIRKTFFDDITVNIEDSKERVETEAAIRQQQELLSERERSFGVVNTQIKTLHRMIASPYFGRFDFHEAGEQEEDQVYIGIASLMDHSEENFLVYDWRAPISSLYYDYSPGPAEYLTMDGRIRGEITLKRQFIINNGTIKGMFDTGITIGDQMLQEVLGNTANTQMKSIVATIQKEQNQIIRHEKKRFLVVQGVAGSGKTSAALQRVAYLLYRYRESLSSENIVLISPNPLFNSYVATVLPELGEENMEQATLQGFIEEQLESSFDLEGPIEQMESYLTSMEDESYVTKIKGIQFKSGLEFKQLIDQYLDILGNKGLSFYNLSFRGRKLISKEEISHYFYSLEKNLPIPNRIELTKEWLLQRINQIQRNEKKEDWVLEEIELLDKEDYAAVHKKLQKGSNDLFNDYEQEENLLRKLVVKRKFNPLIRTIKKLGFVNVKYLYRNLFSDWVKIEPLKTELPYNWDLVCQQTIKELDNKKLSWEDAIPFLYLKDMIKGQHANRSIKHVFIDEAQDYSPFQFAYLKEIYPVSRMTILGDFNQAIYAHTTGKPTLLSDELYDEGDFEKITLTRSYRSTRQIVEFTKGLISSGDMIEPFNRDGVKPEVFQVQDHQSLHRNIISQLEKLHSKGHETVAIICKTMEECKLAYNELNGKVNVSLMNKGTNTFKKGVIILPVYLAKGIEFDAVILYNASNKQYSREEERNLFYTACTRAMHELVIFTIGKINSFLDQVESEQYIFSVLDEN